MVKDGPCCHCGVTSTPLWRNGPPEKPILCNACGSRWRTKGSLTNYVPLHAREALDSDELKAPKIKFFSSKEQKLQKKNSKVWQKECEMQYCDQNFYKMFEGDTSNRSSSGSAISVSDSCMHFGTIDASEITGSVQSNVWDSLVPSKKRTFVIRPKPSPVEKLTKELCSILHEEQASNMSTSHDDLIYESSTPFDSEIGYGGVLIKHPNSNFVEESEASSFPINKKFYDTNEVYSGSTTFPENTECKGTSYFGSGIGKMKSRTEMAQEEVIRDKFSHEKLNILGNVDSTLSYANLNAILNFESFTKVLTYEEQQILMKHLPSIDTDKPPESLKSMFSSPQFLEIFSFFWQLLQEGVFDVSLSGANPENCKNLKRLVFQNCTKVQLLERYQRVKDAPSEKLGGDEILFSKRSTKISKNSSLKRHNNNYPETKSTMKSPKRICKSGAMEPPSKCSSQLESSVHSKVTNITDDLQDHEDACFHPRICFAPLADRSSTKVPMQFIADSSEVEADDLLLDVPSGASFPEAELLYHPWEQKTNQNGLQME